MSRLGCVEVLMTVQTGMMSIIEATIAIVCVQYGSPM